MCGEKPVAMHSCTMTRGSPPRVRGKDSSESSFVALLRITPACAGKRRPSLWRTPYSKDHPRVCGEKKQVNCCEKHSTGSPPRVRGKAGVGSQTVLPHRITPACAGKSVPVELYHDKVKDHPRVCGEKPKLVLLSAVGSGSPPRVRGKGTGQPVRSRRGITPACAGKRCWRGFSPYLGGITPACAGKSALSGHAAACGEDHPRVCGEKAFCISSGDGSKGSPPRVRGKGLQRIQRAVL